mmetsp:Transcript_4276/g.13682  ORF Transcript_4276/g.13682 Transcript_4276/m.13682 type:complete len:194 (-) Transcript_4276:31-612(-)
MCAPNEPPTDPSVDVGPPKGLKVPDSAALTVAAIEGMEFRELRFHLEQRHRQCHTCSYEQSKQRLVDAVTHGAPVFNEQRRQELAKRKEALEARAALGEEHAEAAHREAQKHTLADAKLKHPQLQHLFDRVNDADAGEFVKRVRQSMHHQVDRFEAEEEAFKAIAAAKDARVNDQAAAKRARDASSRQDPDEL